MDDMDHPVLTMISKRFDKVDQDNKDINDKVDAIQETVARHGIYWDVTKWAVPPAFIAILGYIGLTKDR